MDFMHIPNLIDNLITDHELEKEKLDKNFQYIRKLVSGIEVFKTIFNKASSFSQSNLKNLTKTEENVRDLLDEI